jgi:hypothetical protein
VKRRIDDTPTSSLTPHGDRSGLAYPIPIRLLTDTVISIKLFNERKNSPLCKKKAQHPEVLLQIVMEDARQIIAQGHQLVDIGKLC